MTIKNLVISIVGVIVLSASCFSAINLTIDTDQVFPLESNAPSMFTFTWTGSANEIWIPESLDITFTHARTGQVWHDRLFPSIDHLPDMTRDWKLVYTVPIFIPSQPQDADWTLSVSTSNLDFPDLFTIKTGRLSVFQTPFTLTYQSGCDTFEKDAPLEITGFYDREILDDNSDRWIWMSGESHITLPNPGIPIIFNLVGWIPPTVAQGLQVQINGHVLEIDDPVDDHFRLQNVIPISWLENSDHIDIRMQTKEAFTPADDGISQDKRQLGIMLKTFHICVETDTLYIRPVFDLLNDIEPQKPWLWASGETHLSFSNPARDFRIYLQGWIPDHLFLPQNILLVQFNDIIIDTQILTCPFFRSIYHIPLQSIGLDPEVSLVIRRVYPVATVNMGVFFLPIPTIITNLWAN